MNRIQQSELRIQQLTDDKNKNLRVMSTLLNDGKESSTEYKRLEQAVADAENDISMLRKIISNPSYRAAVEKEDQEARDKQSDTVIQQTASAVTANVANIITSNKSSEQRAVVDAQLRDYLRRGHRAELRDVTVTTDSAALVPQEFGLITEATKYTGRIAQEIYRYDSNGGAAVKFPVSDDTANGMTVIAEASSSQSVEADPTVFSTTNPGADDLVGRVDYSKQFGFDSAAGYLLKLIGPRVARALSSAIMVGKDSQANALVNAPTGGYLANIPVGTTTSAVANGIGITDLENLFASLDYSYQSSGSWFLHQKTRDYLQSQKDSQGRSLYGVSPQEGLVNLFGRPVYVDNNLPAPTAGVFAANATPVIFGDHSRAFGASISDTRIKVLLETHADIMVNVLLFYVRFQSVKLVQAASAKLKIAAS